MTEGVPSEQHPHRRRSSKGRSQPRPRWWRAYRFEIVWLAVVALGIFLLFERMNIRRTALYWLSTTARAVLRGIGRLGDGIGDFLARTTVSDAVGLVLLLAALVAIVLRARWRLMRSPKLAELRCPRCGGDLHRVHRTRLDRLINLYVPVRRYVCGRRECRWKGLRVGSKKTRSAKPQPAQAP